MVGSVLSGLIQKVEDLDAAEKKKAAAKVQELRQKPVLPPAPAPAAKQPVATAASGSNPKEARLKAAALKKLQAQEPQELPTEPGKAAPNLQQPIAVVIEIATLADIKSPGIYRVLDKDTLCEAKMVKGTLMHRRWKPSNAKILPPAA